MTTFLRILDQFSNGGWALIVILPIASVAYAIYKVAMKYRHSQSLQLIDAISGLIIAGASKFGIMYRGDHVTEGHQADEFKTEFWNDKFYVSRKRLASISTLK